MTAATDCPTCPDCEGPCGSRCLSDGREAPPPGSLRCIACGHEWVASESEYAQAIAADQAYAQALAREERMTQVKRVCRLSGDECARRCTAQLGGCDTLDNGLPSDGLVTVLRGCEVVEQDDGSVVVLLDLVGVEPVESWDCECGFGWSLTASEAAAGCPQDYPEPCRRVLVRREGP